MSNQVQTPPHRRNMDWYRVKYRFAVALSNRAFTQTDPVACKADYARAKNEVDELLQACWSTLDPLPLERLFGKDSELRDFVARIVRYAAVNLKASIEAGLDGFAGLDENRSFAEVNRRLRKGKTVPPLTIVQAVLKDKEDPGPYLLLDVACFFVVAGNTARAREYVDKALAVVPEDQRESLRSRAAKDPFLEKIPGIANAEEKRRCHWPKRDAAASEKPPRQWF